MMRRLLLCLPVPSRGVRSLLSTCVVAALLLISTGAPRAQSPVRADLRLFLTFEEGQGRVSRDQTGNGHDAQLLGDAQWVAGGVRLQGEESMISVASAAALRSRAFTYDLWFEAAERTSGHGRVFNHSGRVGGVGPEVLERSGRLAIRINNDGAAFDPPTVGTRSNDGPPDHYGRCEERFTRGSGPEHLIVTHDPGARRVRIFQGLAGQPLILSFDATYQGRYDITGEPLVLGNAPTTGRVFAGRYYQLAYYGRVLDHETNPNNRHVVGGELLASHHAGPAATLDVAPPLEDLGPPPVDGGPPGHDRCPELRSREYDQPPLVLNLQQGEDRSVTVTFDGVPAPGWLDSATLDLWLTDSDHPGEEGSVYLNGQGPLDLPASPDWESQTVHAQLHLPPAWLVPGTNHVRFGRPSRARTYFELSRAALLLSGPACAPGPTDAGPPDVDAPDGGGGGPPRSDVGSPRSDLGPAPPDQGPPRSDQGSDAPDLSPAADEGPPLAQGVDALGGGCACSPTRDPSRGPGPHGWRPALPLRLLTRAR